MKDEQNKSLYDPRLFDRDKISEPGVNDAFFQNIVYVNENITALSELQTLSELASQLHNANSEIIAQSAAILSQSETLYINSITENLNEYEKSQAAKLIVNIIRNDPFIKRMSLDNNSFDTDLPMIIEAIIEAKSNPLLNTQLDEIHLRQSISRENADEIVPKLMLLTQKFEMTIDTDPNINQQLLSTPATKRP